MLPACSPSPAAPAPPAVQPPPSVTLKSVTISGISASETVGATALLVATATFSDNSTQTVTTQATWGTSDASIATVSSGGLATFAKSGAVNLQATYQGMSGTLAVSVAPTAPTVTVTSLAMAGIGSTATVGMNVALTVTALLSDGTTANVTTSVTWHSSDSSIATVSPTGAAAFIAVGEVDLQATYQTVTATTHVSVSSAAPPPFDYSVFYGTYNISLTVTSQTCSPPIMMAPTGTVTVASDLPELPPYIVMTLTERGVGRPYYGNINTDGSFTGYFNGLIPGVAVRTPLHSASGTMMAQITGRTITGTENISFVTPCPGGTLTTSFSGSR
jgi:hypothetical protein